MFGLLLNPICEKTESLVRCLAVCSGLLLLVSEAAGGVYQRTRDGKTLVWNNFPSHNDVVGWSGRRDADGYATGPGTLTWYRTQKGKETGSLLPMKGPAVVITRYSGTMVQGKLNGPVINVDPDGKTFQLTFVNGTRTNSSSAEPSPSPREKHKNSDDDSRSANVPAEGPTTTPIPEKPAKKSASKETGADRATTSPTPKVLDRLVKKSALRETTADRPMDSPAPAVPENLARKLASKETTVDRPIENPTPAVPDKQDKKLALKERAAERPEETPTPAAKKVASPSSGTPQVQIASIRSTPPPASTPPDIDSAVRERIIADFKDETRTVLSQVGEATGNFRGADRLESVGTLPPPVSESVGSLVQRARDFRSKIGYETALREFRSETETVDALSVVDQITRSIASNNASEANAKLSEFLASNPEPSADNEKPLWEYLASMRQLCSQLQKEADVHLKRAESFAAASKTSDAIREYQEAYRIFPSPITAEKIRQLQVNSLGL